MFQFKENLKVLFNQLGKVHQMEDKKILQSLENLKEAQKNFSKVN